MGVKTKNPNSKNYLERYRLVWGDVVYQAGEIKIVALDVNNKPLTEKVLKASGKPAKLRLISDRKNFTASPKELIFVEIDVLDKNGLFCPRAKMFMFVKVAERENCARSVMATQPTKQSFYQTI